MQNSLQEIKSLTDMQDENSWDRPLKPKKQKQKEEKMSIKWHF